jgi:hypothetical protein
MDYGMIGKIEKAKRYAQEPQRITFLSLNAEFKGDNSAYQMSLGPAGTAPAPVFGRTGFARTS